MSASANSRVLFHGLHQFRYSRRLLFLNYSHLNSTNNSTSTESSILGDANFNANVIMVLCVILCALICSLGLNSIIRCILKCSNIVIPNNNNDSSNPTPARVANTGVKKKALKTFPTVTFSSESLKLPGLDTECAICLSEFDNGDHLRILPKCNHGFHVRCIDKWLSSHSSCPKCRHCLIHTSCQKKIAKSSSSVAPAETIVRIAPLEPEAMVRNYS